MPRILTLLCLLSSAAFAVPPGELDVVGGPWPRAFFFRSSEAQARQQLDYETWSQQYGRLMGIMGKVLDEEIPGTAERNIPYFTRFKADHPEQALFLHYNGNARDPRVADGFFAGHWLYFAGPELTADAAPGDTVLQVADTRMFRLNGGRYDDRNDDLMIAPFADGKVDYANAEHLELVDVDAEAKTITVRRGMFGTEARAFQAGRAVVQVHATEGPWGKRSNLLWMYNWRPDSPRDAAGRTAADVFVAEFARQFGPGGELAVFDGIEFDVLHWFANYRRPGSGIDSDGDNVPDSGMGDGVNRYGQGVWAMLTDLQAALPDKLWMADGWFEHNQHAVGALNGIESEGWPTLWDADIVDWSGGVNRHRYNAQFARQPRLSYVNHKHEPRGDAPKITALHLARLVQAACVMMDSAFTYALVPPGPRDGGLPIYDELVAGTAGEPGWLGQAAGEPELLGLQTQDLLAGVDVSQLAEPTATAARRGDALVLTPAGGQERLVAALPTFELPGDDLLVRAVVRSEPPAGMPAGVPRWVTVRAVSPGNLLGTDFDTGMQLRGGEPTALDPASGATARYEPQAQVAGEARPAMFVHPPWMGAAKGATWWERVAAVPADARLRFLTAMREAPSPTDGVTFIVTAQPVDEGTEPVEVFREHRAARQWEPAEADLSEFAGQTVRLRFTADPGPADNTTADQAYWGDVRLISPRWPARERNPLTPEATMTWAGPEPFEATFYFRELGAGPVQLRIEAEGAQPLEILTLSAHAAPDVRVRAFEHGLVIANPSLQPVTVDLTRYPGAFRRIQGTPHQDPEYNNGQPAGNAVIVPARDGLFLRREG